MIPSIKLSVTGTPPHSRGEGGGDEGAGGGVGWVGSQWSEEKKSGHS